MHEPAACLQREWVLGIVAISIFGHSRGGSVPRGHKHYLVSQRRAAGDGGVVRVLHRLAWLDVHHFDLPLQTPRHEIPSASAMVLLSSPGIPAKLAYLCVSFRVLGQFKAPSYKHNSAGNSTCGKDDTKSLRKVLKSSSWAHHSCQFLAQAQGCGGRS